MDKNKLKISIKSLQELATQTGEQEEFTLLRKKSMYENYNLQYPSTYSMDINEWGLLDFDINKFISQDDYQFKKEDFEKDIDFSNETITIIQKNNKLVYKYIPEALKDKVFINNIFNASNKYINFSKSFSKIVTPNKNKLTSLNYTLLNAGVYVEVSENVNIDHPIQYYVLVDDVNYSLYNHLTLYVGENSSINFVENYSSKENSKAFNIVSEVLVSENANVNFSSVTSFNENQSGSIIRHGLTHRNALLNWNIAAMDYANVYQDNTTNILGDRSESNLKIVTLGTGNQKSYFNSELINQGLNTNGDILQHGVLLDSSHIVFNGVGFIVKGASGSNAYQSSRLLTLSNAAKADANPMLLIDENDVAAGHGASLGKIDEEQIYYLKSRGLNDKQANTLLIHGFLSPVIEKLSINRVQEKTIELINDKINKVSN